MELHTKSDFTALARKILNPLLPLYSAGGARLHLGDTGVTYPARTIEMEAFSRPLWALGPLWAGGGRADRRSAVPRAENLRLPGQGAGDFKRRAAARASAGVL